MASENLRLDPYRRPERAPNPEPKPIDVEDESYHKPEPPERRDEEYRRPNPPVEKSEKSD